MHGEGRRRGTAEEESDGCAVPSLPILESKSLSSSRALVLTALQLNCDVVSGMVVMCGCPSYVSPLIPPEYPSLFPK